MKKNSIIKRFTKILAGALTFMMVFTLAACGGNKDVADGSADADKEYKIIVNTSQAAQAPTTVALKEVCEKMTEAADGRLKFEVHDSGTLLSVVDSFAGVQDGLADISFVPANFCYDYFGINSRLLVLPFMGYKSPQQAYDIYQMLRSEFPEVETESEEYGIKNLGVFFNGGTDLYLKKSNVTFDSVNDLQGMKVGVSDKFLVEYLNKMGSTAVFTTNADIYTNLDNGVVDAVFQHALIFQVTGCADILNTIIKFGDSGIMRGTSMMLMNNNTYDSLPEDLQKILTDGFTEYCQTAQNIQSNDVDAYNKMLVDKGAELIELSEEEIAPFKDLSVDITTDCIKGLEDMGYQNAQAIYDRVQVLVKTK